MFNDTVTGFGDPEFQVSKKYPTTCHITSNGNLTINVIPPLTIHETFSAFWITFVVAITNGKLDFGPWEQIFYGEFDGQRDKRVLVKVIGE